MRSSSAVVWLYFPQGSDQHGDWQIASSTRKARRLFLNCWRRQQPRAKNSSAGGLGDRRQVRPDANVGSATLASGIPAWLGRHGRRPGIVEAIRRGHCARQDDYLERTSGRVEFPAFEKATKQWRTPLSLRPQPVRPRLLAVVIPRRRRRNLARTRKFPYLDRRRCVARIPRRQGAARCGGVE